MTIKYWKDARKRIKRLGKIDYQNKLVFGSRAHKYNILSTVSEKEIKSFESKYKVYLPDDYRTFLMYFGAGGPGPYYGIYDFAEIDTEYISEKFPLRETTKWPEDDEAPLWNLPGLLNIATSGCAVDWFLEVNGPQPGTMWVDSGPRIEFAKTDPFINWYAVWLDRIEGALNIYVTLQEMSKPKASLKKIEDLLGLEANEFNWDGIKYHRFPGIPGRLKCENGQVVSFDIGNCWIV